MRSMGVFIFFFRILFIRYKHNKWTCRDRIHWLYDTKLYLEIWEVSRTSLLPLLWGSLWPKVVVPVSIPSIGQISQFKNYLYPKNTRQKKMWIGSYNESDSLTSRHKITLGELTWHLNQSINWVHLIQKQFSFNHNICISCLTFCYCRRNKYL